LLDFSGQRSEASIFCEVSPKSAREVSDIVRLAGKHGVRLRTRGNGHALNGSSLPRNAELVVQTRDLGRARCHSDGTVSVGAGAIMWSVDAWLRAGGYALPVLNDGYAGPSVGGFVAAGGFGPGSRIAGGFWDNVAEITIVDGTGRTRRIARDAPLFPWFFGSFGQLGIVVQAKLDVVTSTRVSPAAGSATLAVEAETLGVPPRPRAPEATDEAGRLFWFTLFVPETSLDSARSQLDALELRHVGIFAFRARYQYFIPHRRVVAALLWPHPTPCYAVGSWGILNDTSLQGITQVLAFDSAFTELALINGYKRYIQSEAPSGPALYERYFGPEIYSHFRALKRALDPLDILNKGWVFRTNNE
jgi:FAD/FMN-containing dehydrogenase